MRVLVRVQGLLRRVRELEVTSRSQQFDRTCMEVLCVEDLRGE